MVLEELYWDCPRNLNEMGMLEGYKQRITNYTFLASHDKTEDRLALRWRSPLVMNSRGILKFDWPRVTLLSDIGLHCGQESFGAEFCT